MRLFTLCLSITLFFIPLSASAQSYVLLSFMSNRALDIEDQSLDNGGVAHAWDYLGQQSARWNLQAVEDGFYRVQNVNSGRVLDIFEQSTAVAPLHQWDDLGQHSAQWEIIPLEGHDFGTVALRNRFSGLCMALEHGYGGMFNGSPVSQTECNFGLASQTWELLSVEELTCQ